MGSVPRFYAPLCRLCSSRSSWPFWLDLDYYSNPGDGHPTQLCIDCLEPRRSAFWLRLYSLPRLDASTNLHIASFLHNDLRCLWRRAYVIIYFIQVRESPFQLLTWTRGGEAAVMSDGREVVDIVLDFLLQLTLALEPLYCPAHVDTAQRTCREYPRCRLSSKANLLRESLTVSF